MNNFNAYLKSLFVYSLGIAMIVFVASRFLLPDHAGRYTWASLIYFIIVTCGFHYGLLKSTEGRPQQFVRYFMSATTFKLLLHIVIILAYCLTHRSNAMNFTIGFLVLYILFMIFEIRQAMITNKKSVKTN